DRDVEDDDQPEAGVGQVEALLDVGRQHAEGGGVELVEEEQQEEHDEGEEGGAADDRVDAGAETFDHQVGTGSKCSWAATSAMGMASPHTGHVTAVTVAVGRTGLSLPSARSVDTSV